MRFLVMRRRGETWRFRSNSAYFFAGEATHTDDFSTAHGAYDSGLRVAEVRILDREGQAVFERHTIDRR
jgi:Flavin containing amine oxidoreductase